MGVKKSPKIQKLVVNAIRRLQDVQGSTPREISNYISQEYDVPSMKIQRQVRLALDRAVSYGILQRSKGGHYTCNREFLGYQPQVEDLQPLEKCAPRRVRRAKSCGPTKRRRKARGMCGPGGGKRSGRRMRRGRSRRGGSRRGGSRRRSRRGMKSGCGPTRRKSRRRSGAGCGTGKSRSRRSRPRRSSRRGRQCASDGRRAEKGDDGFLSSFREKHRRARSSSGTRKPSGSISISDEEPLTEKLSGDQNEISENLD